MPTTQGSPVSVSTTMNEARDEEIGLSIAAIDWLASPIVGVVPTPTGDGYWMIAADGGVFGFSAPFLGSVPGALNGGSVAYPVNGMVPFGSSGYIAVAFDGGLFAFGDAAFLGSLPERDTDPCSLCITDVVGVAASFGSAPQSLSRLTVSAETDGGVPYNRDDWRHWTDEDSDCINTRHEVLIEETTTPVFMAGCSVAGGTWLSLFDGVVVTDPSSLDVDHMVPLAEAHQSGSWAWTDEQREQFANDLDHTDHLIAVTASTNRSKGARDPAEWKPPDASAWCRYATAWIDIKLSYSLTIDTAESQALASMLTSC